MDKAKKTQIIKKCVLWPAGAVIYKMERNREEVS